MAFGFEFTVQPLDELNLAQNRHGIVSDVQNESLLLFEGFHIALFFIYVISTIIVADFSLHHFIKKLINTLNITIEIGVSIGMINWDALREIDYGEFGAFLVGN